MTGSFAVQSLKGMHALFVVYNYDTDTIFPVPTKDWKDNTIDKDTFTITFRHVGVDIQISAFKLV